MEIKQSMAHDNQISALKKHFSENMPCFFNLKKISENKPKKQTKFRRKTMASIAKKK